MERDHAIVVGASMAGLLAARVLSDHFARVTILERDPLPQGPEVRKAVPQGAHTHPRSRRASPGTSSAPGRHAGR